MIQGLESQTLNVGPVAFHLHARFWARWKSEVVGGWVALEGSRGALMVHLGSCFGAEMDGQNHRRRVSEQKQMSWRTWREGAWLLVPSVVPHGPTFLSLFPHLPGLGGGGDRCCSSGAGYTCRKSSHRAGQEKGRGEHSPLRGLSKGTPGSHKEKPQERGRGLRVAVSGQVFESGLSSPLPSPSGESPLFWPPAQTAFFQLSSPGLWLLRALYPTPSFSTPTLPPGEGLSRSPLCLSGPAKWGLQFVSEVCVRQMSSSSQWGQNAAGGYRELTEGTCMLRKPREASWRRRQLSQALKEIPFPQGLPFEHR